MNYQWYPGHMTKAKRQMEEDMRLVDLLIELVDARIPASSRNPDLDELARNKARLLLLNKADLADSHVNRLWLEEFARQGMPTLEVDSKRGVGLKSLNNLVREACQERLARDQRRGIKNRTIKAMVVGIPNVGKSTFINSCAGKASTKTGNKPGVTKGKQWIRIDKGLELLDTPGILWPRFEEQVVGLRLAMIGSIKDEIIDKEEIALKVIAFMREHYPQALAERYDVAIAGEDYEILEMICRQRRCFLKGEELHIARAASLVADDFRNGRLGRLSMERPQ
jgi:ribosome biogenesis GTPase A